MSRLTDFADRVQKLNGNDRLVFTPDQVNDDSVGDWVEERLLEFLDAYLRVDRGGAGAERQVVTDPVCGMRIGRSLAAAKESYRGHPYYFCSTGCQAKFARDPTVYVDVKAMS